MVTVTVPGCVLVVALSPMTLTPPQKTGGCLAEERQAVRHIRKVLHSVQCTQGSTFLKFRKRAGPAPRGCNSGFFPVLVHFHTHRCSVAMARSPSLKRMVPRWWAAGNAPPSRLAEGPVNAQIPAPNHLLCRLRERPDRLPLTPASSCGLVCLFHPLPLPSTARGALLQPLSTHVRSNTNKKIYLSCSHRQVRPIISSCTVSGVQAFKVIILHFLGCLLKVAVLSILGHI